MVYFIDDGNLIEDPLPVGSGLAIKKIVILEEFKEHDELKRKNSKYSYRASKQFV